MRDLLKQCPDGHSPSVAADRPAQDIQLLVFSNGIIASRQSGYQPVLQFFLCQFHKFFIQPFKLQHTFLKTGSRKTVEHRFVLYGA